MELLWRVLEREVVPDAVVRAAIRRICAERLRDEARGGLAAQHARHMALLAERRRGPIARHTDAANEQHYEVPVELYQRVLGRRLKYSGAYWPVGTKSLDEAEEAMLELTCRRARVADGQRVLDLGCGWGALSFFVAERFPRARVVAVSNSRTQREHITAERDRRGLGNLDVITADVNDLALDGRFDRVISVEMFEHMWNHERLLGLIARALADGGLVFLHVFTHARFCYAYSDRGATDWMARTFFTGGSMLADSTLTYAQRDLVLEDHWRLDGTHYARTAEAWLARFDREREALGPVLARTYGAANVARWRLNWRLFFLACAELFGYRDGQEWLVSHYLFSGR
jgi:cyclopropane-fatty-acyl-phospholipid synthase